MDLSKVLTENFTHILTKYFTHILTKTVAKYLAMFEGRQQSKDSGKQLLILSDINTRHNCRLVKVMNHFLRHDNIKCLDTIPLYKNHIC